MREMDRAPPSSTTSKPSSFAAAEGRPCAFIPVPITGGGGGGGGSRSSSPVVVPSLPTGRIAALASAINTRVAELGPTATVPFPIDANADKAMRRSGSSSALSSLGPSLSRSGSGVSGAQLTPSFGEGASAFSRSSSGSASGSGWTKRRGSDGSASSGGGGGGYASPKSASSFKYPPPAPTPGGSSMAAAAAAAAAAAGVVLGTGMVFGKGEASKKKMRGRSDEGSEGGTRGGTSLAVKSVTVGDAECATVAKFGDVSSPSEGQQGEADVSPSARAAAVAHLVDLGKQERGNDDGHSTSSEETVPASPETLVLGAGGDYSGTDGARVDGEEEEKEEEGRVAGAVRGAGKRNR